MFSFLKKLVKKQDGSAVTEDVPVEQLEPWLASKIASQRAEAQPHFDATIPLLREQLGAIASGVAALQNAALMNPNIPERAKQVMEGNREAFIRGIEQFAHNVKLPTTLDDVPAFHQSFRESLQATLLSLNRPFQVLQEFFAHEAKEILNKVHELEQHVLSLGRHQASLDGLHALGRAIDTLVVAKLRKQQAGEKLKLAISDKTHCEREIIQAQSRISALESGPEHQLLMDLKRNISQNTEAMKQLRATMTEHFSALEPALKKYEHVTLHNQQLIRDYLANPIETLARDRGFVILQVIRSMRKEIEADKIDLKDRKKEKVLETMNVFAPELLSSFLKNYGALKQKQDQLIADADKLPILHQLAQQRKELQQHQERKFTLEQQHRDAEQSIGATLEPEIASVTALAQERLGIALRIR